MSPANLPVIAFLALIVWRFAFAGLRYRPWLRAIDPQEQRHNNVLEEALHVSDSGGVAVIAGNRFENSSDGLDPLDRKDRAKTYLRRIVALTGATQMGNRYVLDVGTTRFHVRDGYVGRMRDVTDPKCVYEETCFSVATDPNIPGAEAVASALLQLKNNPRLFDKWRELQGYTLKANGKMFRNKYLLNRDDT